MAGALGKSFCFCLLVIIDHWCLALLGVTVILYHYVVIIYTVILYLAVPHAYVVKHGNSVSHSGQ